MYRECFGKPFEYIYICARIVGWVADCSWRIKLKSVSRNLSKTSLYDNFNENYAIFQVFSSYIEIFVKHLDKPGKIWILAFLEGLGGWAPPTPEASNVIKNIVEKWMKASNFWKVFLNSDRISFGEIWFLIKGKASAWGVPEINIIIEIKKTPGTYVRFGI